MLPGKIPSFGMQSNAANHSKNVVSGLGAVQSQQQPKKVKPVPSAQESTKEEGAQFQWTVGQGVDVSDVYPSGRY